MLIDVELMQWIEHYGRLNIQEFVAKSQDMRDVLTYLKAERSLELAKCMRFITEDLVSFKKKKVCPLSLRDSNYGQRMD